MELDRFRSSWTYPSSCTCISLTIQYPIQRCGTAEGTKQHRTTRTSSAFDHAIFSNLISESKLDETLHNTNYRNARSPCPLRSSWRGYTGKALILGKTLTIRLWSIRLDCDAAQVEYVHTIKKLSIILKKNHMDGQKFPLSTPLQVKSHASLAQNPISRIQIYADR
jgi:hypothetical protein